MTRCHLLPTICLAVLSTTTAFAGDEPVRFEIDRTTKRPRVDRVRVDVTPQQVTIVVDRRFGIDGVTVRPSGAKWPGRVSLRFVDFPALESLKVAGGGRRVESRLGFGDKTSEAKVESYAAESKKNEKPLGKVRLPITRREKSIEVELPPELIPEGEEGLRLDWVDAFRG